jgi:uncharacterized protein
MSLTISKHVYEVTPRDVKYMPFRRPLLTSGKGLRDPPARAIFLIAATLIAFIPLLSQAAEVIPPKPNRYFNDYAGVASKEAAYRFNEQLAQFERETSDQVVVAVFPAMASDSDIADYTQRVAQAWGVGQKERRNGVVLFAFIQDRKMYIQVGYGLEGALPDATAFDITERHIKPLFRNGNYEAGLATGIDLICKAIRGEYKGSGKTAAEQRRNDDALGYFYAGFVIFMGALVVWTLIAVLIGLVRVLLGYSFSWGNDYIGISRGDGRTSSSDGGGGGDSSSGDSSSGGGGESSDFDGGGGSFGGGGAGSSW